MQLSYKNIKKGKHTSALGAVFSLIGGLIFKQDADIWYGIISEVIALVLFFAKDKNQRDGGE